MTSLNSFERSAGSVQIKRHPYTLSQSPIQTRLILSTTKPCFVRHSVCGELLRLPTKLPLSTINSRFRKFRAKNKEPKTIVEPRKIGDDNRGNDLAQIMEVVVPSEMSCICIVEWSLTITRHIRSQNLVSRGGHEILIETSHPPFSSMSIYRLGFPDHLQVLAPAQCRRRARPLSAGRNTLSARGEIPDEDPRRAGGLIQISNTYIKRSRTTSQNVLQ